ncbi:MAG: hypothetical protein AAB490_01465 [Patescibacteria group bacterium]
MHDLATIVRMNEEAHQKAIDENFAWFESVEAELRKRGVNGSVQPITKNDIVIAADFWDGEVQCRIVFSSDSICLL